ncbi:MAG TPA: hypothetical protein VGQ02_09625, partial [Candidatus Limnocylindrales bacterium]|nr:hypothetical protein [Candidatus Limnocylindrales bacterium]
KSWGVAVETDQTAVIGADYVVHGADRIRVILDLVDQIGHDSLVRRRHAETQPIRAMCLGNDAFDLARVDAGVEQFILHTMTPDPAQLQDWVDHIIPNVTFPASAGPVRKPNRDRVPVAS